VDDPVSEIAANCLLVRVRMLARAISAIYQREMRGCGLGVSQVNILVCVGKRGECSPSEVGRLLQMERSTVSRNLRPLVEAGWLRAHEAEGGRIARIRLTESGREKLRLALPEWRRAQAKVRGLLGEGGVGALKSLGKTGAGVTGR
jgi:DNA-binding MarR family transcriptional regulator